MPKALTEQRPGLFRIQRIEELKAVRTTMLMHLHDAQAKVVFCEMQVAKIDAALSTLGFTPPE